MNIEDLEPSMEQLAEAMGVEQRDEVIAQGKMVNLNEAVQAAIEEGF